MFLTSFRPERKEGLANWEANSHTKEMKIPFVSLRVSIYFGSFLVFHNYVHNFAFNPNFDVAWCIFIPRDSYNLLKVSSDHPNGAVTALGIVRPSAMGMQGARRVAKSTRLTTFMSQQQLRKVELLYTLFRKNRDKCR